MGKKLREGFTTGSAAAAGAKASILALKDLFLKEVDTPLPSGGRLLIPIKRIEKISSFCARSYIIKDGGDDPDVTHGAEIIITVVFHPHELISMSIVGGKGVGKVTKPGLPVPVGDWAINPHPRKQIKKAVEEAMEYTGLKGMVRIIIEVKNGEKIAKKTLNPKLGIVGGISILGTRGTVKPFSHKAYVDTIRLCMEIAKKNGNDLIALCTGGRSESFLKKIVDLPQECFVQIGDFFGFSVALAGKMGFKRIYFGSFFGKLVKIFQKRPYTHAKVCKIDFDLLAKWGLKAGMDRENALKIASSNTAAQALDIIKSSETYHQVMDSILKETVKYFRRFVGNHVEVFYYLFDQSGKVLKKWISKSSWD